MNAPPAAATTVHTRRTTATPGTLRRRLRGWALFVLALSVTALATAGVTREQRELLHVQRAAGESFIQHLADMPQFQGGFGDARAQLRMVTDVLRASGVSVELARSGAPAPGDLAVLASREVTVDDGLYELRYAVTRASLRTTALRSAATYGLLGLVAIVAALVALELLLRVRLADPLRRLVHQMRFMRSGGGWEPVLPAADAEIAEVNEALCELGPALHEQVEMRIAAERRAAAAEVLSELRGRLRPPKRLALALLGDLQARSALSSEAKQKLRRAIREVERLSSEIDCEEVALFDRRFRASSPSS